jgi:hypothetical protein
MEDLGHGLPTPAAARRARGSRTSRFFPTAAIIIRRRQADVTWLLSAGKSEFSPKIELRLLDGASLCTPGGTERSLAAPATSSALQIRTGAKPEVDGPRFKC